MYKLTQEVYNKPRKKATGFGNTRSNLKATYTKPVEVRLDYLRIMSPSVPREKFERMLALLDEPVNYEWQWLMDKPTPSDPSKYPNRVKSPSGIDCKFGWERDGNIRFFLDMSGTYFQDKSVDSQWVLAMELAWDYGVRCTRVDVAITDENKMLQFTDIHWAVLTGNVARKQKFHRHISGDIGGGIGGYHETYCLGSRESDSYVRIYDCNYKHGIDAMRYEVEFKGDKAAQVFEFLLRISPDSSMYANSNDGKNIDICNEKIALYISEKLAEIALAEVEFVDRSSGYSNGTIDSCNRLPWWQKFIDFIIGKAPKRLKPREYKRRIDKTKKWVERQVVKTLAVLCTGMGRDNFAKWLAEKMKEGRERLTEEDQYWVRFLNLKYGVTA